MPSNDKPSKTTEKLGRQPIAVVGVSALFPGSVDSTGFWADILDGTDRMTDVPASHWLIEDHYDGDMFAPDKTYGRRGGFLDTVDLDVMKFGIPPTVVPSTDTAQLLALIVAQRVLDDATTGQFSELDRSRASVILGVTSGQELLGSMASRMNRPMWLQGMRRAGVPEDVAQAACAEIADLHPEWTESTFPGLLGNVVAGRIANRLDLGGTNCVTDAACASSFSALSMGVNELYLGDSDLVIAGGVDTMNDIFMYMCFSKTPALSKSEDIRPFSDQADGTMLGEGIGMVALKRLSDAERDGNHIYCVINGVGSSSDGRSKSVYAPVSAGQARALSNAYEKTSYGPDTVELIEAHGTGTVAGDAAEFGGLQIAFDAAGRQDRQWCALGSVKSQIGHTKAAAGAAGLFKVVMALHHKVLPQTAKIDTPNPKLDLENSPFSLNSTSRPWVRGSDHERRGSVSSFGFGGSNFHVALSEYTGPGVQAPRLRTSDSELVVLTGPDGAAVVARATECLEAATIDGYLQWLAQSTQLQFDATDHARLALVASDEADLRSKLEDAIAHITRSPDEAFSTPSKIHYGIGQADGDIAFVFPGQGSQYVGMGAELAMHYGEAMGAWDAAADIDWEDTPLQSVVFPPTSFVAGGATAQQDLLTATQWAQPAIGATSLCMLRLLRSCGVSPSLVGGHSFGEITALHAAGVLSETDTIRVARKRGELMAEAAQAPGSMTAVARTIDEVRALVEASGIDVVVANHNSHTQVVLSGATDEIERMEARLKDEGITAKRLPVATAFHSPIVSGASQEFTAFLQDIDFGSAELSVYGNETAQPYPGKPKAMRKQLGRQLANSVRFVEMIEDMYANGARTFVEVGPGSTLTGLIGKILKGHEHRAIATDRRKQSGLAPFLDAFAQLAVSGASVDFGPLWSEYGSLQDPHQTDKPKLAIGINGANYGSPYPPQDLAELAGPNSSPPAPAPAVAAANSNGHAPRTGPERDTKPSPLPATAKPTGAAQQTTRSSQPARPSTTPSLNAPSPKAPSPKAPMETLPTRTASPATLNGSSPSPASANTLAAFAAIQQQTAEAHAEYLRTVAQVHTAFLATTQQSIAVLGQLSGVDTPIAPALETPQALAAPAPITAVPSPPVPAPTVAPSPAPAPTVPAAPAAVMPAAPAPTVPAPVVAAPKVPAPVVSAPVVSAAPVSVGGGVDGDGLMGVLLGVVSEKTGYPSEMLTMGMELEGDLGIDSIKRVEILSAMQDEVPSLPEVDAGVMAELVTLGQIVDYMSGQIASSSPPGSNGHDPTGSGHFTTTEADAALGRFALSSVTAPATGSPIPGLTAGPIAVTNDGGGIGASLVALLNNQGAVAQLVDTPDSSHRGVIFLGGLADMDNIIQAAGVNRAAFAAARSAAPSVQDGGMFVTVTDLGGTFGVHPGIGGSDPLRSWSAGLTGLARTAAIEWPKAGVRAIDIDRGGRDADAIAAALAAELFAGGPESEVGLAADGTRSTLVSTRCAVEHGPQLLGSDDVIVVSGGGRGVTASTMIELAAATGATFVLLGRSAQTIEADLYESASDDAALKRILLQEATSSGEKVTPAELNKRANAIRANREISDTVAAIERVGGQARYLSVDVTDRAAVAATLGQVRSQFGPITGLVHGAGVLADKLIADKTDEQFDLVFDTKVGGLQSLLEATVGDPLKLLCFFSSVAARTGNQGQADYAMANEVLNKVAQTERHGRGTACVVKSLGWGPWEGGMVSPALKAHFESMGVSLIPVDVGARMLVDEIASPQTDDVELVLGGGVLPENGTAVGVARA